MTIAAYNEEDDFFERLNSGKAPSFGPAFMQLPAWDDDKGWAACMLSQNSQM